MVLTAKLRNERCRKLEVYAGGLASAAQEALLKWIEEQRARTVDLEAAQTEAVQTRATVQADGVQTRAHTTTESGRVIQTLAPLMT